MKSLQTLLAETLFIDMINGNAKISINRVEEMALSAQSYASMFYSKVQEPIENPDASVTYRTKGCRACYGSGGKANKPCKVCGGSGKVQSTD